MELDDFNLYIIPCSIETNAIALVISKCAKNFLLRLYKNNTSIKMLGIELPFMKLTVIQLKFLVLLLHKLFT